MGFCDFWWRKGKLFPHKVEENPANSRLAHFIMQVDGAKNAFERLKAFGVSKGKNMNTQLEEKREFSPAFVYLCAFWETFR